MSDTNILRVDNIEVVYEQVILAARDISFSVPEGGVVALLGANGAGKTSILKAISSLVRCERGEVVKGSIVYQGRDISHADPAALARAGLVQVLEGRHCFPHLTIEENLLTGAFVRKPSRGTLKAELEKTYAYFPHLKERRRSLAGYASGGEQQMVAIGRALMAKPKLVLLDEPSMGLAPQIVDEIFDIIGHLNGQERVCFLIAEQNTAALRHAGYGYVIENGHIVSEGTGKELLACEDVKEFYLGRNDVRKAGMR